MKNRNRITRAAATILALALALAALASCGGRSGDQTKEITFTASPERVKEGDAAVLAWDVPGSEDVRFNGRGRKVAEGEKADANRGPGPDVYAPFPASGRHTVIPSEEVGDDARAPVVTVKYAMTATMKDGGAPVRREAAVDVHFYVSPVETLAMQKRGEAVVLDVRDARFFEASDNIPGAVNIQFDQLERRAGELPTDKTIIVTYVGGNPDGEREAWAAVWKLAERGRKATVLRGGVEAWWRDVTNAKPGRK